MVPPKRVYIPMTLMIKKQRAIGIPVNIRTNRIPNMSRSQSCQSIRVFPAL
jgi:hypothetical protein